MFFMISVGLPQIVWVVLGGLCLAIGVLLLALGIGCWLMALKTLTGGSLGWKGVHREETEAFTVNYSDDVSVISIS
jgi:hypothetical protein